MVSRKASYSDRKNSTSGFISYLSSYFIIRNYIYNEKSHNYIYNSSRNDLSHSGLDHGNRNYISPSESVITYIMNERIITYIIHPGMISGLDHGNRND